MVRQSQSLSEKDSHRVDLAYREHVGKRYDLSDAQFESFRHITGDRDVSLDMQVVVRVIQLQRMYGSILVIT